MPVIISQVNDDGHEHRECLVFVRLQDIEEIIVLEEAHGSVGDLEMNTADTSDNSFE